MSNVLISELQLRVYNEHVNPAAKVTSVLETPVLKENDDKRGRAGSMYSVNKYKIVKKKIRSKFMRHRRG